MDSFSSKDVVESENFPGLLRLILEQRMRLREVCDCSELPITDEVVNGKTLMIRTSLTTRSQLLLDFTSQIHMFECVKDLGQLHIAKKVAITS